MDKGSMDPHFGPGPWTTYMKKGNELPPVTDRVYLIWFVVAFKERCTPQARVYHNNQTYPTRREPSEDAFTHLLTSSSSKLLKEVW